MLFFVFRMEGAFSASASVAGGHIQRGRGPGCKSSIWLSKKTEIGAVHSAQRAKRDIPTEDEDAPRGAVINEARFDIFVCLFFIKKKN
jgi:hypothetical protein